ncbi:MAG: prephenate dehydrogenase [Deltaproteobacteria bacterium]|nr:prephenate dehydrogenase [Deltaproteobacteria bacterium]
MKFHRIIIVGVGQIGASIGLNLSGHPVANQVIGVDTDKKNLLRALKQKSVDETFRVKRAIDILKLNLSERDLVILAAPVLTIRKYLELLPQGPLVMDVGSTKGNAIRIAGRRQLRFIGAHPMAGTEKEGAGAADKKLFRDRLCLLTPLAGTRGSDREVIAEIWKRMGSRMALIDSRSHDSLLAPISHLPHLLAYTLIGTIGRKISLNRIKKFSGGGLRDTTRIAASSAAMWADIFLDNSGPVLDALDFFLSNLKKARSLIQKKNGGSLKAWLKKTSRLRRELGCQN